MKRLAILLFALPMAANAAPILIDFESLSSTTIVTVPSYSEDGFTFTSSIDDPNAFASWGTEIFHFAGSAALFNNSPNATTTLFADDGSSFSLDSIELAPVFFDTFGASITFTGTFSGGGTISQTFGPLSANGFTTFSFAGFRNLMSVSWDQIEPFHQFDNLVINVPEPGTLGLFGIGLLGIGLARRRRTQQALEG